MRTDAKLQVSSLLVVEQARCDEEADHHLHRRSRPSEGPYELDDGRVIYANTYPSSTGVWNPRTGNAGTYADVGGGPNAGMLGSDGCVYSTQTPNVGTWIAPVHRPPSIQKTSPSSKVEIW